MSSMSSNFAHIEMPALLTSVSRRPNSATVRSMSALQSASLATSAATTIALAPLARHCAATPSRAFVSRADSTSCAPFAASCNANSAPMPFDAPVITTTFPVRLIRVFLRFNYGSIIFPFPDRECG